MKLPCYLRTRQLNIAIAPVLLWLCSCTAVNNDLQNGTDDEFTKERCDRVVTFVRSPLGVNDFGERGFYLLVHRTTDTTSMHQWQASRTMKLLRQFTYSGSDSSRIKLSNRDLQPKWRAAWLLWSVLLDGLSCRTKIKYVVPVQLISVAEKSNSMR